MGSSHSTLASIHATSTTTAAAPTLGSGGNAGGVGGSGGDEGSNNGTGSDLPLAKEIIDAADPQLSSTYQVDRYLVPGSGRMMRTFRLKHKQNGSMVVVKVMWIVMATDNKDDTMSSAGAASTKKEGGRDATNRPTSNTEDDQFLIQAQQQELARIHQALHDKPHMAPFLHWQVGAAKNLPPPNRIHRMTVRPAVLVRPHFYTTLSDRLASRPFLTHVEKLWIVYQLLRALDTMHGNTDENGNHDPVVHGFLTTENVGLSSWNWVVLMDVSSYKARTALPDNDPSEYLYWFQELNQHRHGSDSTPREKRCYLAPERFYTPGDHRHHDHDHHSEQSIEQPEQVHVGNDNSPNASASSSSVPVRNDDGGTANVKADGLQRHQQTSLTPAMDIFSAGCVIIETFLNGERALDLGDLMEYRTTKTFPAVLQQRLNKIEFSALRAACRHMLHLDPTERLSAREYLERLEGRGGSRDGGAELIPASFDGLARLMGEVSSGSGHDSQTAVMNPDARMARAAAYYGQIVWDTVGIHDENGMVYFKRALGSASPTSTDDEIDGFKDAQRSRMGSKEGEEKKETDRDLFAETEALLKKLEALSFDDDEVIAMETKSRTKGATAGKEMQNASGLSGHSNVKRSRMSESSLLIYLQLVLSTVRHVQRPASKLVALQLTERVSNYSSDETRLQRIVPATVALLQDQDPLVRASAIRVLTSSISLVETFPPSDSKVFPQYVFKRVAHMTTDPSLVVRLAFARSVAVLAETAHRFLDISHAVRLYEAVGGSGGGASGPGSTDASFKDSAPNAVFGDDIAKLLDDPPSDVRGKKYAGFLARTDSAIDSNSDIGGAGKTLISSTYNSEVGALHETVSRWVVHITTDLSEHSSPVKRVLLEDMARLCNFFGLDGVMAFILPQLLSFLNDRKDWQLRASLFDHLQSVCQYIGRAATEHFVLPCLETALVDNEEVVISRALYCLSQLLRVGLLSRAALLGARGYQGSEESSGLLKKYGALLLHPSSDIRYYAIATVNALCESVGPLDVEVFVVPIIRPYLRFQPSAGHLFTPNGLEKCLYAAWTWGRFENELKRLIAATDASFSPTAGEWTSIGLQIKDIDIVRAENEPPEANEQEKAKNNESVPQDTMTDEQTTQIRLYLRMLARRKNRGTKMGAVAVRTNLDYIIEGSLKLAQRVKFPRQDATGLPAATLPAWYDKLRALLEAQTISIGETTAIRTVSALGEVYGLSIMDQAAATPLQDEMSPDRALEMLKSEESKRIQAACAGEWGAETFLDPTLSDTSLLVTKLSALDVPPLPPRLGQERHVAPKAPPLSPSRQSARESGDPRESPVWKPKIDTVVATSRRAAEIGHTGPVVRLAVANDQRFFVSGSHDGTCRIWESEKAERSNGVLESTVAYSMRREDSDGVAPRVNDVVMVEGGHSVASGGSDGSIHVWRVDMVSSSTTNIVDSNRGMRRVAGRTTIRQMDTDEGEILAVNQYNSPGASILMYATQKHVHSWDLRSAKEPFCLKGPQDTGYITSMAMGSDRNWAVIGTNRGFVLLWDLRFQHIMKLWHHSRSSPIDRLATSFVPPPQTWVGKVQSNNSSKPFLFVASGPNECGMFDATTGSCSQCFRAVEYGRRNSNARADGVPVLTEIPLSKAARRKSLFAKGIGSARLGEALSSSCRSVNAMIGSIGASDHSFLITGGSDCRIRFWDFSVPSKCYVTSGMESEQPRPSFERIDYGHSSRLMLCRQAPLSAANEVDSSKIPRKLFQGTRAMQHGHYDAIQDLKVMRNGLVSCSRDCTVKIWK